MPLSRSRDYLSIGEVLEAVRPEFSDISISKIRFLESEGLLEPERTQSGYRKFYEKDLARLRYILTLQRDHFLPLKVIKDRIAVGDGPLERSGGVAPGPLPAPPTQAAPSTNGASDLTGVQMTRSELISASGLNEVELAGLEDFGVISARDGSYDENDLLVAQAARGFLGLGLEARHLRMYKQFADREIAFFEQLITPTAHRRDPDGAREAGETVRKLEGLSRSMREGMLRAAARELL